MFEEDDNSDLGKVYIIKLPKEKLKFLAETKRIFFLNISTGLLYKKVNTLPYVIMEDIYISKRIHILNKHLFQNVMNLEMIKRSIYIKI